MEFRSPLLGASGHHVDFTDPFVIQQEHRLLLLKCDRSHSHVLMT